MAAASIGQTYRARLHSGESVVVKVQRPDIGVMMERDLAALALLANLAQRRTPFGQGVRSGEMLAQFADGLRAELDFRQRGRRDDRDGGAAARAVTGADARRCTASCPAGGCSCRSGSKASRSPTLRARRRRVDRAALAEQLLRATLDQIMHIGLFHADPHPGNVFALPDGTLGLIDFGAVGRLDPIQQSAIVDMMVGPRAAQREPAARRRRADRRPRRHDVARAARARAGPADGRARPPRRRRRTRPCMEDLVATLSRFGMRLPADVVLLSRALVTVDGTLRVLRPDLSLVAAATELVAGGEDDAVVDRNELARRRAAGDGAPPAPHPRTGRSDPDAGRARRPAGAQRRRRGQPADRAHARQPAPARPRRGGVPVHVGLAARRGGAGPTVAGETGLFDVFGYGGLLIGVVLVLRVVAAIARDGTT